MPSKFVSKSLLMIRSLFSRYLLAVQPTGNCIFFSLSDGSVNMRHGQDNADPFRFLLLFFFQSCLMSWGICLKVSKKNFCTVYAWVSCIYSFFSLLTIQTTIHDALTHNELEYKRLELHWAGESWTLPVIQCYIRNAYPSFWLCRREQSCRRTWRRCWTYPTPARRSCKPVTGKQNRHELYTCFTKQAGYGKDQRDHYNRVTNSYPCSIKGALLARKTLFPIFFWILTTPL